MRRSINPVLSLPHPSGSGIPYFEKAGYCRWFGLGAGSGRATLLYYEDVFMFARGLVKKLMSRPSFE